MTTLNHIHQYLKRTRNLYFTRSVLRGLLMFLIFLTVTGFLLLITDLALHFSSNLLLWIRIFYYLLLTGLFVYYFLQPVWYWIIHTKPYSLKWIAHQIGKYDKNIDDKLVNILELEQYQGQQDLILASISQKAGSLDLDKANPFFTFRTLRRQFFIFVGSLFFIALFSMFSPDSFQYSSRRIFPVGDIDNRLPYTIKLVNTDLRVDKRSDITIRAKVHGQIRPEQLFIQYENQKFAMNDSADMFTFTIKNVRHDFTFKFSNEEFTSKPYPVECIPVPILKNISATIIPPGYTHLDKRKVKGSGNFEFPYGSKIRWEIDAYDTDTILFIHDSIKLMNKQDDRFTFTHRFFKDFRYKLVPYNDSREKRDTVYFKTSMIPDQYPAIKINEKNMTRLGKFSFRGTIQDDFGFHSFQLLIADQDSTYQYDIPLLGNNLTQPFRYGGNLKDYKQKIGHRQVKIYLKLKDNDPFYPYKPVKSHSLFGRLPGDKQLNEMEAEKVNQIKDKLNLGSKLLKKLREEKQAIQKRLLSEETGNWERKQLSEQIQGTNEEIKRLSNQIKKLSEDLEKLDTKHLPENLQQKKDQLKELLDQLMDEELEQMMKELQKLQKELLDKNKQPDMKKFDISMKDIENELDRNIEMLKRYEVEKKQQEIIDQLNKLSQDFKNTDSLKADDSGNQLDSLKESVDETFKEHKKNLEKNKELSSPYELDNFEKDKEQIEQKNQELQNPSDLENPQKNPADDLEQLAQKMQMNMNQAIQQQQGEDAAMIRKLLENLLQFSFTQEELISQFNNRQQYNFNQLKREQINLEDRFSTLNDSLQALMKRNQMVASAIGNQLENIYLHFEKIKQAFQEEQFSGIQIHQQKIMQSTNELILMLNESLDNMQSMSGMGGNCKKKGQKSKPGMGGLKKQQKGFKKSLQQMIDQLKKGQKPGKGQQGMSKKLSQMLGQQEKMQQLLQQIMQSGDVGKTSRKLLKEINRMVNQNIDDILQRDINDNMLKRQQKIMTRMLEAEKAEQEREKEKKRRAEKPKNYQISNPDENLEYKEKQKQQKGFIHYHNLQLKYFFQRKYDNYVNQIENN